MVKDGCVCFYFHVTKSKRPCRFWSFLRDLFGLMKQMMDFQRNTVTACPRRPSQPNAPGVGQTCCLATQPGQVLAHGPDGPQQNCHALAQPATQQKEEAHQPMCLKHYWSQEIAELPRPIQHPGESLEMKQFILTQCLVFSESEKRVTDKKPTGKVSPPTGSPTPELRPHQCNTTQWPDTWVWTLPCSVEPSGTIFRASLGFGPRPGESLKKRNTLPLVCTEYDTMTTATAVGGLTYASGMCALRCWTRGGQTCCTDMLSLHYSQFAFMLSMYQTRQSEQVGLKTVYPECKRDRQVYGQIHNNTAPICQKGVGEVDGRSVAVVVAPTHHPV
ncbi:uncharacterized protein LOC113094166 isoform X2 [Carassius auratus]|uniref:Uncharacterized protein LOC113094166 isoform X2 n=1 Tax=Carassius auratus TaxID=7957 RepID=A0A6P6P3V1_CARAU|nr:uncharacterized protein LOC113094166 isoform X2 [Carassius auratus]XP_026115663.1 uncharacterized protein LOC113094166 isoform X2 [Carassius auratus]XP_026115664.1 uncharacterized protein LOC113094166 isoform X2 [Carassius auratus]